MEKNSGKRERSKRQPGQPWTVNELATEARVSPAHVYGLVAAGEIQAIRFGAAVRIPDAVAQEMLGQKQTAA